MSETAPTTRSSSDCSFESRQVEGGDSLSKIFAEECASGLASGFTLGTTYYAAYVDALANKEIFGNTYVINPRDSIGFGITNGAEGFKVNRVFYQQVGTQNPIVDVKVNEEAKGFDVPIVVHVDGTIAAGETLIDFIKKALHVADASEQPEGASRDKIANEDSKGEIEKAIAELLKKDGKEKDKQLNKIAMAVFKNIKGVSWAKNPKGQLTVFENTLLTFDLFYLRITIAGVAHDILTFPANETSSPEAVGSETESGAQSGARMVQNADGTWMVEIPTLGEEGTDGVSAEGTGAGSLSGEFAFPADNKSREVRWKRLSIIPNVVLSEPKPENTAFPLPSVLSDDVLVAEARRAYSPGEQEYFDANQFNEELAQYMTTKLGLPDKAVKVWVKYCAKNGFEAFKLKWVQETSLPSRLTGEVDEAYAARLVASFNSEEEVKNTLGLSDEEIKKPRAILDAWDKAMAIPTPDSFDWATRKAFRELAFTLSASDASKLIPVVEAYNASHKSAEGYQAALKAWKTSFSNDSAPFKAPFSSLLHFDYSPEANEKTPQLELFRGKVDAAGNSVLTPDNRVQLELNPDALPVLDSLLSAYYADQGNSSADWNMQIFWECVLPKGVVFKDMVAEVKPSESSERKTAILASAEGGQWALDAADQLWSAMPLFRAQYQKNHAERWIDRIELGLGLSALAGAGAGLMRWLSVRQDQQVSRFAELLDIENPTAFSKNLEVQVAVENLGTQLDQIGLKARLNVLEGNATWSVQTQDGTPVRFNYADWVFPETVEALQAAAKTLFDMRGQAQDRGLTVSVEGDGAVVFRIAQESGDAGEVWARVSDEGGIDSPKVARVLKVERAFVKTVGEMWEFAKAEEFTVKTGDYWSAEEGSNQQLKVTFTSKSGESVSFSSDSEMEQVVRALKTEKSTFNLAEYVSSRVIAGRYGFNLEYMIDNGHVLIWEQINTRRSFQSLRASLEWLRQVDELVTRAQNAGITCKPRIGDVAWNWRFNKQGTSGPSLNRHVFKLLADIQAAEGEGGEGGSEGGSGSGGTEDSLLKDLKISFERGEAKGGTDAKSVATPAPFFDPALSASFNFLDAFDVTAGTTEDGSRFSFPKQSESPAPLTEARSVTVEDFVPDFLRGRFAAFAKPAVARVYTGAVKPVFTSSVFGLGLVLGTTGIMDLLGVKEEGQSLVLGAEGAGFIWYTAAAAPHLLPFAVPFILGAKYAAQKGAEVCEGLGCSDKVSKYTQLTSGMVGGTAATAPLVYAADKLGWINVAKNSPAAKFVQKVATNPTALMATVAVAATAYDAYALADAFKTVGTLSELNGELNRWLTELKAKDNAQYKKAQRVLTAFDYCLNEKNGAPNSEKLAMLKHVVEAPEFQDVLFTNGLAQYFLVRLSLEQKSTIGVIGIDLDNPNSTDGTGVAPVLRARENVQYYKGVLKTIEGRLDAQKDIASAS